MVMLVYRRVNIYVYIDSQMGGTPLLHGISKHWIQSAAVCGKSAANISNMGDIILRYGVMKPS